MKAWNELLLGAIAGIVATGPMTAAMVLMHRRLPLRERYPLPPREITMKLARESGVASKLSSDTRSAATLLSHFAYGAVCGAIYTASVDPRPRAVEKGLLFGLLVWVGSYLGWLPATGILRPATEHPVRRNLLMIAAHFVWGLALAGFAKLLSEESRGALAQPFSTPGPEHDATG